MRELEIIDKIIEDSESHIRAFNENPTHDQEMEDVLLKLKVCPSEELKPPQVAWKQVKGSFEAILGTLGNFSLIIGKAKSRKSFFINLAISAVLSTDLFLNLFIGDLPPDKSKVIYFDTEQGKYHVQLALKRICKQLNIDIPKNLNVYGLRSLNPSQRLKLIEYAIYNTPNIGFVVIDGIKDLINSINDESEATMVASKLLKWTEEKDIHIVCVLHQNKNDNNARGHLGSELSHKAETVLSVTKNENDKDISIVEAIMCRNIEPQPFAFEIIDGLPSIVKDFEIRTQSQKNKFDATELPDHEIYGLLNVVFLNSDEYGYSELVRQMKLAFKDKYTNSIGDNRIKELISYCKSKEWLRQEKAKTPYKQGKFNHTEKDTY